MSNLKCLLGHEWDEWQYLSASSCKQQRKCRRCDKSQSREIHNWGDWHLSNNNTIPCQEARECQHCKVRETRQNHIYGEVLYVEIAPCKIVKTRICQRCEQRKDEELLEDHRWGEWEYETRNCQRKRTCQRCGAVIYQAPEDIQHQWSPWQPLGEGCYHHIRRCQHCGVEEHIEELRHYWNSWEEKTDRNILTRYCSHCAKHETKPIPNPPPPSA